MAIAMKIYKLNECPFDTLTCCAPHAHPLLPTAMAFVPYGFVLVQVQVHLTSLMIINLTPILPDLSSHPPPKNYLNAHYIFMTALLLPPNADAHFLCFCSGDHSLHILREFLIMCSGGLFASSLPGDQI
jgi:hypothetical protein